MVKGVHKLFFSSVWRPYIVANAFVLPFFVLATPHTSPSKSDIRLSSHSDTHERTNALPSFSVYQPILDRMPFGALPPDFGKEPTPDQTKDAAQVQVEQQKLAKQINMSCVNITPEGKTAIGFTDLSDKTPVNYYLLVGTTGGGWSVLAADYDEEWAQLKKDDVTITLKLGKGLIDAPPTHELTEEVGQVAPSHLSTTGTVAHAGLILRTLQENWSGVNPVLLRRNQQELVQIRNDLSKIRSEGGDVKSYMEQLRERKQQEKAEKDAAEQAAREQLQDLARTITQDELKKKEREMNLKLIGQGARPISDITLTPEEEQSLYNKGALAQ